MSAGILKQSVNNMRAVISPKLGAAQHMSQMCCTSPIAFNVLYSSVSSIAGFSGHANYCAANAALDSFAGHSTLCGLPTVAVQWGAWSSIGKQSQLQSPTCTVASSAPPMRPIYQQSFQTAKCLPFPFASSLQRQFFCRYGVTKGHQ